MYESFYGLTERPFNLTPDPRYLYLSEKHKEAFAHLLYGIKNRSGFVMVTGEIGTGKTTISRTLLGQLDSDTEVAFVFNPSLSPEELLGRIVEDFGIESKATTIKGLIDELNAYLLDRNAKGKNCVLVIDEAQNLPPQVLEQIRLLSNLETERQKLLQIVLIGQPELGQHLALPELRQLNQRITARYHLQPLDREETLQYIAYRLRVAGGRKKVTFTRGALNKIYRYSGGTPRVINALCDRALLIGYTEEVRDIPAAIVRRAFKEIRGERVKAPRAPRQPWPKWVAPTATAATAAAAAIALGAVVHAFWPGLPAARIAYETYRQPIMQAMSPAPKEAPEELPLTEASGTFSASTGEETTLPPPEAPTGGAPANVLDTFDAEVAGNAGVLALLRAWDGRLEGEYPSGGAPESFVRFAEDHGLESEVLEAAFPELISLNLPAMVRIAAGRHIMWVGLVGIDGDTAEIASGPGETVTAPLDALRRAYADRAVLFWRDPTPNAGVLSAQNQGAAVQALQEQLRALGWLEEEPNGVYNAATQAAVEAFQQGVGIDVDGLAGRQTRMALLGWAANGNAPSLVRPSEASDEHLLALAPEAAYHKHRAALQAREADGVIIAAAEEASGSASAAAGDAAEDSAAIGDDADAPAEAEPEEHESAPEAAEPEESSEEDVSPADTPVPEANGDGAAAALPEEVHADAEEAAVEEAGASESEVAAVTDPGSGDADAPPEEQQVRGVLARPEPPQTPEAPAAAAPEWPAAPRVSIPTLEQPRGGEPILPGMAGVPRPGAPAPSAPDRGDGPVIPTRPQAPGILDVPAPATPSAPEPPAADDEPAPSQLQMEELPAPGEGDGGAVQTGEEDAGASPAAGPFHEPSNGAEAGEENAEEERAL